jgi:NAD(P)-dependent dehydrogenase (short-subunit alcohol dehydrogenase family)
MGEKAACSAAIDFRRKKLGELDWKVALVTGGASWIRRTARESFAREGSRAVVSDIDEAAGQETVHAIRAAGAEAFSIRTEVFRPASCQRLVEQSVEPKHIAAVPAILQAAVCCKQRT